VTETDFGQIVALLAFASAVYTVICAVLGAGWRGRPRRPELARSAARGVAATGVLIALTIGALLYALWIHDFNVAYVTDHSNLEESHVYDLTSLWAGQSGSLMLWCLMLSIFAGVVVWRNRDFRHGRYRELMPWVIAVLMTYQVFFLGLINFVVESPWTRLPLDQTPPDGVGLMPLLQNPLMTIHPPALYTGYVALGVPFAFAMAALITGRVNDEWIAATRRWTLFAWIFLGCGLLLGGNWAYNELGWGGFWGWDPVENVALLPWLTATAFLHSILIQQRRGMLKIWNMALVITTFSLTLFGTFMNRSGIESSVHAFEGSALGLPFVLLIAATVIGALALLYWRLPALGVSNRLDSFLSRESAFLMNNLLLVGIAFAIFWGTIFPILSQAVRGAAGKVTVSAPFYNKVTGPLFLVLLLLMAAGPLLPWRRASAENMRRNLLRPFAAAVVVGVVSFVLVGRLSAALSFAACAAVIFTMALEFYRGARAKRRATGYAWPRALVHLVDGNHGRYGGYLVHAGIALVALGVTGSMLLKTDVQTKPVRIGQTFQVGSYQVTPLAVRQSNVPNVGPEQTVTLRVAQNGHVVANLPARAVVFEQNAVQLQAQSEAVAVPIVTVDSNPLRDIYVTLTRYDPGQGPGTATVDVHVLINPLTWWVWVGGLVVLLGGLISFTPNARERRVTVAAPVGAAAAAAR